MSLKQGTHIGAKMSALHPHTALALSLPKCKDDGILHTWTDSPVMEGRKSINTYIFMGQRKGHDFELQPHINCVPLRKSLKPIQTQFILLHTKARESTLYAIKHYTHSQCSVQDTASIQLRCLWSKGKVRKKFNNFEGALFFPQRHSICAVSWSAENSQFWWLMLPAYV